MKNRRQGKHRNSHRTVGKGSRHGKKAKRWPAWKIMTLSILGLLVVIAVGLGLYINRLLGGLNYEDESLKLATTVDVTTDPFGFVMPPPEEGDNPVIIITDDSKETVPASDGVPTEVDKDPSFVYVPVDPDQQASSGQGSTDQVSSDPESTDTTTKNTTTTTETTVPPQTLPAEEIEKIVEDIRENYEAPYPVPQGDVVNILLIGVDSRNDSIYGRSDTMILASINHDEDKLVLSSFLRDTLAYVPGYGYTKLGHANAYGGPNLLMRTIRENFKINVDKYALVNFNSMAELVNGLGGINVSVTAAELRHIPNGIRDHGGDYKGTKKVLLTGEQTVAYARIRKIGTDFARTSRQRTVMEAMLSKLRSQSPGGLLSFIDRAFPLVTTNIPKGEILSLAAQAPTVFGYPLRQFRLPIDGSYVDKYHYEPNMLVIDYPRNLKALHDAIY